MSDQEHRNHDDGAVEPGLQVPGQRWDGQHVTDPSAPGSRQADPEHSTPVPPAGPQPGLPPGGPLPQGQTGYGYPASERPFPAQQGNPWAPQQGNPWAQAPSVPGPGWGQPNPYQGGPYAQSGYMPPPKPGIIPLRPLGLGEIMDGAFQACRRNVLAAFGNAFVIQAGITLLIIGLGAGFIPSVGHLIDSNVSNGTLTGTIAGAVSTVFGVSLAGVLLIQGLLVLPVARATLNLKTGFGQVWRLARGSLRPLFGLALLMLALAAVGVTVLTLVAYWIITTLGGIGIAVVIPALFAVFAVAVWVSVKLSLAPAVLVMEGSSVLPAIRRSWHLTGGNWWRTFGILMLTSLIVNVVTQVITVPFSFLIGLFGVVDSPVVTGVLAVVLLAVTLLTAAVACAFQSAVTALLYLDLRIRREGFDLALMKDQESPHSQDPDFLPGRNAVPLARNTPFGPATGTP